MIPASTPNKICWFPITIISLLPKKRNNSNKKIGWLTGWLAASLKLLLHLLPKSINGPKCWLGAQARALRARPRAPMLVLPASCCQANVLASC